IQLEDHVADADREGAAAPAEIYGTVEGDVAHRAVRGPHDHALGTEVDVREGGAERRPRTQLPDGRRFRLALALLLPWRRRAGTTRGGRPGPRRRASRPPRRRRLARRRWRRPVPPGPALLHRPLE